MKNVKKLTFSLTSLVALFAFGFVCFAPSVFADGRNDDNDGRVYDLTVTISAAESMIDVDARGGANDIQIATGRDRASRVIHNVGQAVNVNPDTLTISLLVQFSHVVNLAEPGAQIPLEDIDESTSNEPKPSGGDFGADDLFAAAYDKEGRSLGVLSLAEASALGTSISQFRDTGGPGRQFLVRIDESQLRNAYIGRGAASGFEVYSLVFFIPRGIGNAPYPNTDPISEGDATVTRGIRKFDRAHALAHFGPGAHQHLNNASNEFQVDLVDDDQGDAQYAVLTGPTSAQDVAANGLPPNDNPIANRGSGTPGVVSIMRTVDRAGFIEDGPFDVRIILTEEPMGGLTADKIMVTNGSVTSVVKGATYKGGHPARAGITDYIPDTSGANAPDNSVDLPAVSLMDSELGPAMVAYYQPVADVTQDDLVFAKVTGATLTGANAGAVRIPMTTTTDDSPADGTVDFFPQATGRDNMYHSYIATIAPDAGLSNEMVTVSIAAFDDSVWPVPNRYVPLTPEQRDATTLTGAAKVVRDARVKNESLTVRATTSAAGKTAADLAKDAYDIRQAELNSIGNETVLGNKSYIPAGGYLVIVVDAGAAGIAGSSAKLVEKRTTAQKLYNIFDPGDNMLPFPGDDLSNLFRNGGTLNLAYKNIPEATKSGHADSKGAPQKKDDKPNADFTGYTEADDTVYAKGALLISEIMWGLDGAGTNSQYIELHNPGTTAIGIDNKEWLLTVGNAPAGYTVIDTVGNNPDSGYWQVPGTDGVSKIQPNDGFFTLVDLVSMSRVSDAAGTLAADGTAAASWAKSKRPSSNLSGRRIGTPGAANLYDTSAADAAKAKAEQDAKDAATKAAASKAPAAKAADLRISEIMVTSNDGRLPQWIEIANVSGAAVSLMGWSIGIDNDPMDADVIAPSVNLKLGDVTIGKDQVALVVSKAGRNSGVDTAGAARTKGDANAGDLDADRIINVQQDVSTQAQYSLISEMAFRISLIPPLPSGAVDRGDVVGNLGMGWELPMAAEGSDRSSLIRREMGETAEISGTDAAGWVSADDTSLVGAYTETYYGDADDMGTPGYNAGGALPVELSKFNAKRDPLTGAVMITWETQSELNNAGFFIKRSQQKNGQFQVVNPTMIPGAGTISEKQSYTYTDTTAQPNIVYYYQIEDVSLDGQRQTLTRAHRLKGHVGAAGKATTTWGELKTSREQ